MILGRVKAETLETGFAKRRQNVSELDDFLVPILERVYRIGKTPILVGGGHNNAYPLIKAFNKVTSEKLDVINLDAHADFRNLEGRHSGNSFSYAWKENCLKSYTVLGLHRPYNSDKMLEEMSKEGIHFTFFEDYLDEKIDLFSDTNRFLDQVHGKSFGIELDMDAIAFMPSSAYTPSGWSVNEARKWLRKLSKNNVPAYINLTEGACELGTTSDTILGKTLAYFVYDLINK